MKIFILLFLIMLIPTAFAEPPAAPKGVPVEVTRVETDLVADEVNTVGTLLPAENVIMRSEIPGRIATIHFSEGQLIDKGKPLVTLDSDEYKAQLDASTAEVKLSELNFERQKDLLSKNAASRQNFDEVQAKLTESRAKQNLDQTHLEKTKIRAPFKGVLGLRNISEGAYIQAGDDLVSLMDVSSMKLDFRVPEKFVGQVKIGQTVKVTVDAYFNKDFSGKIIAIDAGVDEKTRTMLLRARVSNDKNLLYPGMFARVNLTLDERRGALLIPEQAIVPQGQDSFVFKVNGDKVVLTKVKLGQRQAGTVEIIEGLHANDKVVVAGQMKLRDGAPIMAINQAETPQIKSPTATNPSKTERGNRSN
jgi:membrane fusion protein (multidrug efflux system)